MGANLLQKQIIIIHGLASKPPENVWLNLCRSCLIENVRIEDSDLADELTRNPEIIQSAYWADSVPYHIPDDHVYCNKLQLRVDDVIRERRLGGERFHVGPGEDVGAFFRDRGKDLVKIFSRALALQEAIMKSFLEETRLYSEEQYIADRMRKPLEKKLTNAWKKKMDVALISHSMGTFITFDVLWRFSHRNVAPYSDYSSKKVQLFVTMGSPLCEPGVKGMLFARHHSSDAMRRFPTNVQMWHNYSCLGDVVCHGANFQKDYFDPLLQSCIIPGSPKHLLIYYSQLYNPFVNVAHDGNADEEKRNPHKEYGYLVQPRLGSWLVDFLKGTLKFAG